MNILVVIPVDDLRKLVVNLFRKGGHRVFDAIDYEEGLKGAQVYDLDLVITSIKMPEHSGFELIREIAPKKPHTRFMFMRRRHDWGDPEVPADVEALVLPGDLMSRKDTWIKALLPD